ncbi:hypothetical protein DPQ33_16650 [Oceanidesulfovibrio indonesiensis]|uniref:Uncharacterized protein n=1 Tax=Oceanidesulfovibrio indonesiensis TaxID=54767 RepID=A0A7M3MAN6_9BACT|nr:hypothetical protein DPQ33_16650 [Oceanidesulfovibrio indonesiensis]
MDTKTRHRIEELIETLQERARSLAGIEADSSVSGAVQQEASAIGNVAVELEEWLDEERRLQRRASRMAVLRGVLAFLLLAGLLAVNVYVFRENSLVEDGDYLKVVRQFFPEVADQAEWAEYLRFAVAGCLGFMSFLMALVVAMFLEVIFKAVRLPTNALVFALLSAGATAILLSYYMKYFGVLKEVLYRIV